jgi:two-component system, chemotaxis family, CheB/CheR fusion protein
MSSTDDGIPGGRAPGDEQAFMVVGLGGSAGGIDAFKEFLRHVPPASDMAYVVILHLSPDYESRLAEILQTVSPIPVTQVNESVRLEPNHVYVMPPNRNLATSDGGLVVSEQTGMGDRRSPIDSFFRRLAESHAARAVSVIVSGTGADGSVGLKQIKENNGLVLVQDPAEARFDTMPRMSIETGLADYVLPVAAMPAKIMAYRDTIRAVRIAEAPGEKAGRDQRALTEIFATLRARTGHDFSNYKRATIHRRLERRLAVHEITDLTDYAAYMREHREEAGALLSDLLISVTHFFRDGAPFEALEAKVIPALFHGKSADDQIRVWVPGCATGEEAYSIAILLAEHALTLPFAPDLQVFATDIDEAAVARARSGHYSTAAVTDVSPERLRQFFLKEQDGYRVRRELREMILFAHHNLIKDPPFSHLDLVSCRNLLIYFNRAAQARAMEVLHFGLNPGGYLLLGTSETADSAPRLFDAFDKENHIFLRRNVAGGKTRLIHQPIRQKPFRPPATEVRGPETPAEKLSALEVHQRLLEQYAPPSLVVNHEHDLVHLSARAGRYLEFAAGEASTNLLRVIRPELRIEVRAALYQASHENRVVQAPGLTLTIGEVKETVNVIVRPVTGETPGQGYFLLVFEPGVQRPTEEIAPADPAAPRIEEELIRVKGEVRSTIEHYETQAEDLRAANEELQATNEELRSATEELETSQEELQSVNEELHTVNQELKIKIDELSQANNDMRNLMSSTAIGTIFLDRRLCVKLFTPPSRELYNLIPADVGRRLLDITSNLVDDSPILPAIESVLDHLHTIDLEVETRNGSWHLMRLLPYRTVEERIDGVVMTFFDITERKHAEAELQRYKDELEHRVIARNAELQVASAALQEVIDSSPLAILTIAKDRMVTSWNPSAERLFGWNSREIVGKQLPPLVGQLSGDLSAAIDLLLSGSHPEPHESVLLRTDGSTINVMVFAAPLHDEEGRVHSSMLMLEDITDRKRVEREREELAEAIDLERQRLREVFRQSPTLVCVLTGPEYVFESANPVFLRTVNRTSEEIVGRPAREALPERDAQGWLERFDRAVASGEPAFETETRVDIPTDEKTYKETYWNFTVQPLRGIGGAVDRLVVHGVEITAQVTARRRIEGLLADKGRLLHKLVDAQESERLRIARELHDEMGQHITALKVGLEALPHPHDDALTRVKNITMRIDQSIDRLALELRPAALEEAGGLYPAITDLVEQFTSASGIAMDLHTTRIEGVRMPDTIEATLFRVLQEALTNVWKHAKASQVSVIVERRPDQIQMIIEDDGQGFDPEVTDEEGARTRYGLRGIRERAALVDGSVSIESRLDEGTTIYVRVPLPADGSHR